MDEELKEINGFRGYYISNRGNVYSYKTGNLKKLNPYVDSKGNYLMIRLIRDDGQRKSLLVHRLVAIYFVENPNHLPEVNHIDKNKQNPDASNLEWCTRKSNLYDSYKTLSPIRNRVSCDLYINNVFVKKFESIRAAAKYAAENYKVSRNTLERYYKCKHITIIPQKVISGKCNDYSGRKYI